MSQSKVKDVVHLFWSKTSIKGIPRTLQSDALSTRIFWGVATTVCFSMLIYQTSLLLSKYFQYMVVISAYYAKNASPDFPDVSICNLNPYGVFANFDRSYEEYLAYIGALRQQMQTSSSNQLDNDNTFWRDLQSQQSYISSQKLYSGNKPLLSGKSSFITDCLWNTWNWNPNEDLFSYVAGSTDNLCKEHITTYWDPNYYQCYQFHQPVVPLLGFSAIMYVDDFPPSPIVATRMQLGQSSASGVRMYVHTPTSSPLVRTQGFSVSPGTEITITLDQAVLTHQPPPYGPCTFQSLTDPQDPTSYLYQQRACQSVCRQQQIIDNCGCAVGFEKYTTRQMQAINYTMCASLILNPNNETDVLKILEKPKCANYFQAQNALCNCPKPCFEMIYTQTVAEGNAWPAPARQLSFYDTYIKPHPEIYGDKFDAYGELQLKSVNMTNEEIFQQIKNIDLIRENFIQLNIQFLSQDKLMKDDIPAVTWDLLFANLGSALNLWMGVTILFVAEVAELAFTAAKLRFYRESADSVVSSRHHSVDNVKETEDREKSLSNIDTRELQSEEQTEEGL